MMNVKDKKKAATAFAMAVALTGVAFGQAKPAPDARGGVAMPKTDRIAMADFKKLQAKGEVVVIDVRAESSYVSGHIPGALSMPEGTINASVAEKLKRMGKPVAAYCS